MGKFSVGGNKAKSPGKSLDHAAQQIIDVAKFCAKKGWTPATSSNFSVRIDEGSFAVTVSGKDKGMLEPDDVMAVDLEGKPLSAGKPSAETYLHGQVYRLREDAGCVLHTHSPAAVLFTECFPEVKALDFENLELLKAFTGIDTHEAALSVPVVNNHQDMQVLAGYAEDFLQSQSPCWGYVIRGHGLYTWGPDPFAALRHAEALEYLIELDMKKRNMQA